MTPTNISWCFMLRDEAKILIFILISQQRGGFLLVVLQRGAGNEAGSQAHCQPVTA